MYEELVKALRNCGDTTIDGCVGCAYQEPQMLCNQHLMTKAAEAILELRKPRWIPVTERLPDVGETIMDTTFSVDVLGFDGWDYQRAYYNYTNKVWLNGNDEQEWPGITHWMPLSKDGLPESPKEET